MRNRISKFCSLTLAALLVGLSLARCNDMPSGSTDVVAGTGSQGDGAAPVACFTTKPDPPEVAAQEPITLDASCSANVGPDASFSWNLGDGRSASGRIVEAQYRRSGEYTITLTVQDGGRTSEATEQVRVRSRVTACFVYRQILEGDPEPCTVAFDASCSTGAIREYRWFFEGGPRPDLPLPDTTITTTEPQITYSWGRDEECFSFRPFDRIVRLTVVDEGGSSDEHEETVVFSTPILKP